MKLRFSLRTLLIVTTLVCIVLVVVGGPFRIYYAAVRHQKALALFDGMPILHDGFVHIQNGRWINAPPNDSNWVAFARQRIHPLAYPHMNEMYVTANWSASRDKFKEFKNLRGLRKFSANIDSFKMEDAKNLSAIPELRECVFSVQGPAEPGAMALLAAKSRMKTFIVHPTDVLTCEAISKSSSLIEVGIGERDLTQQQIQAIAQSTSIKRLILINVALTPEILAPIGKMKQLKELELFGSDPLGGNLEALADSRLESIIVNMGMDISPEKQEFNLRPIAQLAKQIGLRRIQFLSQCTLDIDCLTFLAQCEMLENLQMTESVVNVEGLALLSKSQSLTSAAFAGDLPDEAAQAFVDAIPGRELTLYTNGFRESHKPGGKRIFVSGKPMANKN